MVHTESTRDILLIRAHAKVNLALAVDRVNESGLHPICSWMHGVELHDEIEIRRVPDGRESKYAIGWKQANSDDLPVAWDQSTDLSVRAHILVETYVGRSLGVQLRVSKAIPAGGGLGGGSSDAAGVLMGLNTLFALGLDQQTLAGLAMSLGSDVPFFIDGGIDSVYPSPRPALVRGVGGSVERVECRHAGTAIGADPARVRVCDRVGLQRVRSNCRLRSYFFVMPGSRPWLHRACSTGGGCSMTWLTRRAASHQNLG